MDIREDDMEYQAVIFVEACKTIILEYEDYKRFLNMADWADSENTRAYYKARAKAKLALFEGAKRHFYCFILLTNSITLSII